MRALAAVVLAVLLTLTMAATAGAKPKPPPPPSDTQPPTAPTSLTATAVSQTSVTLTWGPSTDNKQVLFYGAWAPDLSVVYVNHPGTTATFTNLHPGTTYAFRVQAWDGTNWSLPTPILDVTTSPDVVAPSAPTGLTVGTALWGSPVDGVTASKVLLTWTNANDDFGPIRYEVLVDGVVSPNVFDTFPVGIPGGPTSSMWVRQLDPGSTSTFTVRTVDGGGNVSVPSNAVTVTTDARSDSVAPTTPTLTRNDVGGTGACPEELWIRWTGSTDNLDPAAAIEYEVRINGVIYEVIPGGTETVTYTDVFGPNTVTIVAVDQAGNASVPSNAMTGTTNFVGTC